MTNERAIELLHRLQDEQFDGIHGDERREALEMAVKALEGDGDMISRQAVMKEFSDFVRKSNNSDFAPTPTWNDAVSLVGSMPSAQPTQTNADSTQTNALDCVSRQEAIDALRYAQHRFIVADKAGGMGTVKWSEDVIYFAAAERVLNDLPPAQRPVLTCDGCRHVGTYDTDFPCSVCIRREKDYYEQE